jgi:hypothetical protein
MPLNPYDRRRREMFANADASIMGMGMTAGGPRESPVRFEDIEALVYNAQRRGHRERDDELLDREHAGRRQGWDEGYAAGEDGGRVALLGQIEDLCGADTHAAFTKAEEALRTFERDPKKVSREDLAVALRATHAALGNVIANHHNGFSGPLPF